MLNKHVFCDLFKIFADFSMTILPVIFLTFAAAIILYSASRTFVETANFVYFFLF